ncbi:4Fe-4S cluster-binding domain-containing protein, partial [bacterium]|nr:4Fe-4S cluster-binding domain-containing protein [bacterium]
KKYKHFMISEYNKRTIQYKMKPRSRDRFWLEVNLADHCNLNCQMCDHFAPIAEKTFMSIEVFDRDMKRLAMLMENEMGIIKLQGGEPFLNKDVIEYMRISRELFPKSVIWIFTDGILLLNSDKAKGGNVWEALKKYNLSSNTLFNADVNLSCARDRFNSANLSAHKAFFIAGNLPS